MANCTITTKARVVEVLCLETAAGLGNREAPDFAFLCSGAAKLAGLLECRRSKSQQLDCTAWQKVPGSEDLQSFFIRFNVNWSTVSSLEKHLWIFVLFHSPAS